jgi:hypothetical protein
MDDKAQLLAQSASRTLDDFFDRVGIKSKHNLMHFTVMCLAALITGLNIMSSVFVNVLLKLNDEWRSLAEWQYSLLSSLFFLGTNFLFTKYNTHKIFRIFYWRRRVWLAVRCEGATFVVLACIRCDEHI